MEIKLSGGVLIIGSLLWDKSKIREEWRQSRLCQRKDSIDVSAPIRYGRISKTRNCTYSMVFSNDCSTSSNLGSAKFFEFNNNPVTLEELWTHCTELIKAEFNSKELSFKVFNWSWGALGLCINPSSEKDKQEVKLLKKEWNERYGKEKPLIPSDFEVNNEGLIINNSGILNIEWKTELKEYDFFITALTKPEVSIYPTSHRIAEKMIVNDDDSYFNNDLLNNIKTFQDEEIKLELDKIKSNRQRKLESKLYCCKISKLLKKLLKWI